MYFFQQYLGDRLVAANSTNADVISYGSSFTSGETGVAIINKAADPKSVQVDIKNFKKGTRFYWYTLTGGTDNGEFSRKTLVNGVASASAAGGPANYKELSPYSGSTTNGIRVVVPGRAAVFMVVSKQ